MKPIFLLVALGVGIPLATAAQVAESFDPERIDVVDAIECRLDAPTYNGFALALNGEEKIADKRHWVPIKSRNFLMNEYELPAPITVAGRYSTRRIAFTSSGVVAILDLADPAVLARQQGIENAVDPNPLIAAMIASGKASRQDIEAATKFRKFLGEKILVDRTEPATAEESFGTHTLIGLNISNVDSHPGKTLYGCSYRIEVIDKDGKAF